LDVCSKPPLQIHLIVQSLLVLAQVHLKLLLILSHFPQVKLQVSLK